MLNSLQREERTYVKVLCWVRVWQEWRIVNKPLNELKMQRGGLKDEAGEEGGGQRWLSFRLKKIILSTLLRMDWSRLIMRLLTEDNEWW